MNPLVKKSTAKNNIITNIILIIGLLLGAWYLVQTSKEPDHDLFAYRFLSILFLVFAIYFISATVTAIKNYRYYYSK